MRMGVDNNMNWMFIVVIFMLAVSVLRGLKKGLVRTVISTFFLAIVIVLSIWAAPRIGNALYKNTNINHYFTDRAEAFLNGNRTDSGNLFDALLDDEGKLTGEIDKKEASLSETVLHSLITSGKQAQAAATENLNSYLAPMLGQVAVYVVSFLLAFIGSIILLILIMKLLDSIMNLPVLGFLNTLGGAAAGLIRGLLILWLFFALVSVSKSTYWGSVCLRAIQDNNFLSFFYSNNLLVSLIKAVILN